MRLVLYPLLSEAERVHLQEIRRATWANLHRLFLDYAFLAGPTDVRLLHVASVVQRMVERYADAGTRAGNSVFQEVVAFRLMREQMGNPLPVSCKFDARGNSPLYRFCKLCWRPALPSGLLCVEHSPVADDSGRAAVYQEGRRMNSEFNVEIGKILTRDVLAFHEGELSTSVLHWPGDLAGWLRLYRPHVAAWMNDLLERTEDQSRLAQIVVRLRGTTLSSHQAQSSRSAADEVFIRNPDLLWPIWVRAEAWLSVRLRRSARWGGRRRGSGR